MNIQLYKLQFVIYEYKIENYSPRLIIFDFIINIYEFTKRNLANNI